MHHVCAQQQANAREAEDDHGHGARFCQAHGVAQGSRRCIGELLGDREEQEQHQGIDVDHVHHVRARECAQHHGAGQWREGVEPSARCEASPAPVL